MEEECDRPLSVVETKGNALIDRDRKREIDRPSRGSRVSVRKDVDQIHVVGNRREGVDDVVVSRFIEYMPQRCLGRCVWLLEGRGGADVDFWW